jgi:hypothetical protein
MATLGRLRAGLTVTVARKRRATVLLGDQEFPIAEVIAMAAQRCISAKPVAVMIAWETASGKVDPRPGRQAARRIWR